MSGRIDLAVAATAVVAVQTMLAALSQVVVNGAAVFHTSLHLGDPQSFLDDAAARGRRRLLTLRRGQVLAVVGANGSGKWTLTRLLTGIHLPDKGSVSWNGTDLAEVEPASVWARTGPVPQVFAQRPLRVRENVTLGQPHSHDDVPVREAVDAVGLRGTVEGLPAGPETLLARDIVGGRELSGGQWQRIACSRPCTAGPAC